MTNRGLSARPSRAARSPAAWSARWPVRRRFTVLFAGGFVASALVLLVLINVVAGGKVSEVAPGGAGAVSVSDLAAARERIAGLEAELSAVHEVWRRQLLVGSLVALLVVLGLSVALGAVLARRVVAPLRSMTETTRRISAETLHARLGLTGPDDEVKHLADTIDELLDRLEAAFSSERRFVANASHELRTPLTTMRAAVDVASVKADATPALASLSRRLRGELDRVDDLLEGLLVLSRANHRALPDKRPISLAEVATASLAARAADLAARGLVVVCNLGAAAGTTGSATLLCRVVDNLVDNAVVHASPHGPVVLTSADGAESVSLVVETAGPTLEPSAVARLGRPFERLSSDRTGSERGSGLGLSIAAAIAHAHGGELVLSARTGGGLRAELRLPSARRHPSQEPAAVGASSAPERGVS
jgi:signal transduction histidine kinase